MKDEGNCRILGVPDSDWPRMQWGHPDKAIRSSRVFKSRVR
jgi:hypothetical protein